MGPGVIIAHECEALGTLVRVETRFTGVGSVETYVNGKRYGEPLYRVTLAGAVRRHLRVVRNLVPVQQMRLDLP